MKPKNAYAKQIMLDAVKRDLLGPELAKHVRRAEVIVAPNGETAYDVVFDSKLSHALFESWLANQGTRK